MTNIQNPYARQHTLLNGAWNYIIDPYETGSLDMFGNEAETGYFLNRTPEDHWASEYNFAASPTLQVPGDWNSQEEQLRWYEGTVWFHKALPGAAELGGDLDRVFIRFGAANYSTIVWVNGTEVVRHVGGFTPFEAEIGHLLKDDGNFVVVKVNDTRLKDGVPTTNTDWWNYGGITRDVMLITTPATFVRDYFCQLNATGEQICGHIVVDGDADTVTLDIEELGIQQTLATDDQGRSSFSFPANPIRWTTEAPKRYEVKVSCGSDEIIDQIGFRTIATEGEDILLNGEPIFLKGISTHEEAFMDQPHTSRRAHSIEDARRIFAEIKALGCNFARLAHYTHNDFMTRVADEMGILLWCEVPVYWGINWQSSEVLANAENQLTEMIERDRNVAAIILWSVANETPTSTARTEFLASLVATAKRLDPVRLTTAALFMHPQKIDEDGTSVRTYTLDDPLAEHLDVMGCNQYLGWYYTKLEDIAGSRWFSDMNKPLIMSEFGAGAPKHRRGGPSERWTEDYQNSVYQQQLEMMESITFLRGLSPWILKDFRTPKRPLAGIQDYYNRKGLLSDIGEKKLAWHTLHDYYKTKTETKSS